MPIKTVSDHAKHSCTSIIQADKERSCELMVREGVCERAREEVADPSVLFVDFSSKYGSKRYLYSRVSIFLGHLSLLLSLSHSQRPCLRLITLL